MLCEPYLCSIQTMFIAASNYSLFSTSWLNKLWLSTMYEPITSKLYTVRFLVLRSYWNKCKKMNYNFNPIYFNGNQVRIIYGTSKLSDFQLPKFSILTWNWYFNCFWELYEQKHLCMYVSLYHLQRPDSQIVSCPWAQWLSTKIC